MTVQFVEIAGQKMAMLPFADYERLIDIVEDKADISAAVQAEQRRDAGEEYLHVEMVDQILAGESALKVWRKFRSLTLAEVSKASGSQQSMLSRIENGQLQGRPGLWRKLADTLNVSVDDILPVT